MKLKKVYASALCIVFSQATAVFGEPPSLTDQTEELIRRDPPSNKGLGGSIIIADEPELLQKSQARLAAIYSHPFLALNGDTLVFEGQIDENSAMQIKALFAFNIRKLIINSPGGVNIYANEIVDLVAKNDVETVVTKLCFSACTIIFQAGRTRSATRDAVFMYHDPYIAVPNDCPKRPTDQSKKVSIECQFYELLLNDTRNSIKDEMVTRFGFPKEFSEWLNTHGGADHYFSAHKLAAYGVVTRLFPED